MVHMPNLESWEWGLKIFLVHVQYMHILYCIYKWRTRSTKGADLSPIHFAPTTVASHSTELRASSEAGTQHNSSLRRCRLSAACQAGVTRTVLQREAHQSTTEGIQPLPLGPQQAVWPALSVRYLDT